MTLLSGCCIVLQSGGAGPDRRGHDECVRVPGESEGTEEGQGDGDVHRRGHQTGGGPPTDGRTGKHSCKQFTGSLHCFRSLRKSQDYLMFTEKITGL